MRTAIEVERQALMRGYTAPRAVVSKK